MNIGEVSEWVGLANSTIRKYLNDFGEIEGVFSDSATPRAGRHRRFTNRDVAVIAWISKQYSDNRLSTDAIAEALKERVEDGEPFEEPPRPEDETALAMIPREQHEAILAANQQALDLALAERDAIERLLDKVRERHQEERGEWQKEIARLNREIGRLEQQVRGLEDGAGGDD
jgi:DNA-binding transcriptional MerR regulator